HAARQPQTRFYVSQNPDTRELRSFPTRRSSDLPELLVREEMRELAAELGPVADDERGARRLEEGRRLAEVRRVRAHQHGLPAKRSEEHTSELQSRSDLVCRLLLEKKIRTAFHPL